MSELERVLAKLTPELVRKHRVLDGARALGLPVCELVHYVESARIMCTTCVAIWDDDQHFTCPKFGIVHE